MTMFLILMIMTPFMLTMILFILNLLISMKSLKDREKPTPFECGFNPITSPHLPFSIQFFFIGIIFLIFDIEIIILTPLVTAIKLVSINEWFKTISLIMLILIIGTLYEFNEQTLKWMN